MSLSAPNPKHRVVVQYSAQVLDEAGPGTSLSDSYPGVRRCSFFFSLEAGTHGQRKDERADDPGGDVLQRVHGNSPCDTRVSLLIALL